jgi:thymidylate synthase
MQGWQFTSAADSLKTLCQMAVNSGDIVAPRGEPTFECRNVTVEVEHPYDCTMPGIGRGWVPAIGVAEALQLIGGFSDPDVMVKIAPAFDRFRSADGSFYGAYGPRLLPILPGIIDKLTLDPSSRQAVAMIWHPRDVFHDDPDIPCTVSLNFHIRDDLLHMITHMRSNDIWLGWPYDVMQFTQLQCSMANALPEVELGGYTHIVDSMHLYERDADKAKNIKLPDPDQHNRPYLFGVTGENWSAIKRKAQNIFYGHRSFTNVLTMTEQYFWDTMRKAGV